MHSAMRRLTMGISVTLAMLAAGCASVPSTVQVPVPSQEQAIMCAKCQAVWVKRPHEAGKVTVYHRQEAMVCPDCRTAAETYFATGRLEHTCRVCGSGELCNVTQEALKAEAAAAREQTEVREAALMCPACRTVWVRDRRHLTANKLSIYRSKKVMVCENCDANARSMLRSGKPAERCDSCGGRLESCKAAD